MERLILESKNGEPFFHKDGLVFHETYGNKVSVSVEVMIRELSH